MSSGGGDTRFLPERELPGDARLYIQRDGARTRPFEPLTVAALPVRRDRTRIAVLCGAVVSIAAVVAGLAFWVLRPPPGASTSSGIDPTTPVPTSADPGDERRLARLVPSGYPAGSCRPIAPPKSALAQVYCNKNSDPGGPLWATYTLVRDKSALDAAFNDLVESSTTVVCPGNIQSPGPWRRNATPDKISGVLYCGTQDGRTTVAWTDEAQLMLSAAESSPQGPTFSQLFAWWSSHS